MTRFHFQRPDGPPDRSTQNISVILNEFVPPQGFEGAGVVPPIGANMLFEDSKTMQYEDGNFMEFES